MADGGGDIGKTQELDALIIGAGFGGLAAALEATERGLKVGLCEALKYPGGCASTFTRDGVQYESGATLFSGLDEAQLFGQWRSRLDLPVHFDRLSVPIELRTASMTLPVPDDRSALIDAFCQMPDAPVRQLRAFFGAKSTTRYETTWSEALVRFLPLWPVRAVLIAVLLIGFFIETAAPGYGAFGLVSLAALALLLGAPLLAGMAEWWTVAVVLIGLLLDVIWLLPFLHISQAPLLFFRDIGRPSLVLKAGRFPPL